MLILEPGFSTADEVSRLAGRGVGMDVVASEVRQLGGTLDIHSSPGKGVTFTLRLPQTLAVTQAVFVRIGETTFAVPIASVRGVGRIAPRPAGSASTAPTRSTATAARTTRCTTWACCSAMPRRRPKATCRCRCC